MPDYVENADHVQIEDHDLPQGTNNWELVSVNAERDSARWWRKTSADRMSHQYQTLTLILQKHRSVPKWKVSRTSYSAFRATTQSSYQLTSRYVYPDESGFEYVTEFIADWMQENPGVEGIDGKPTVPEEVTGWELTTEDPPTRWEWKNKAVSVRVVDAGLKNRGQSVYREYDVVQEWGDRSETTMIEGVASWKAFRSAIWFMEAFPEVRFWESKENLTTVKGVGPAKARKLQALGIRSREDVRDVVTGEMQALENAEFRDAVNRVLTDQIREWVAPDAVASAA